MNFFGRIVFLFLCVLGIWWFLEPVFLGKEALLASFDDDAFYYFKIAENIVAGQGSTFNGIHETNGYHPLWMGVLVLLKAFAKVSGIGFLFLVRITIAILYVLFFCCSLVLVQRVRQSTVVWFDYVYLALCAGFYLLISAGGMEVALTLPLMTLLMLLFFSRAPLFWLFFTGALVVLSRLDAIIVIFPFFLYVIWNNRFRFREMIPGLITAGMMLAFYLFSNLVLFDTPVPISGLAKSARGIALFSPEPWESLFSYVIWRRINLFTALALFFTLPVLLLFRRSERVFFLVSLLCGVVLFYTLTAARSDWQMWPWYFYPDYVALTLSWMAVVHWGRGERALPVFEKLAYALVLFFVFLSSGYSCFYAFVSPAFNKPESPKEAVIVAAFMDSHPGLYAMGDRAGRIGYLSRQPMIQLEGLVMDKTYLETLRGQGMTLHGLLEKYGVDYYIVSVEKNASGCYDVVEPYFGGAHTVKVKGEFCAEPFEDFRRYGTLTGLKVFAVSGK